MKKLISILGFLIVIVGVLFYMNQSSISKAKSLVDGNDFEFIVESESRFFENPNNPSFLVDNESFVVIDEENKKYLMLSSKIPLSSEDEKNIEKIQNDFEMYETEISSKHEIINAQEFEVSTNYLYKVIFKNKEEKNPYLTFYYDENSFINTFDEGFKKLNDF
ncbi:MULTISPECIES: hypothetical protein [Exiguobacterium]|uniref:hypothetical protein n=1 Tax=Exiguobacterium TaxID=33986 RepID=UPI001BE931C7|nr:MULTISPECIES: hypothetical protein [Exiguobacterium]MCA0980879.1 hypothetical protein [Exiguobacterium aestuarii]